MSLATEKLSEKKVDSIRALGNIYLTMKFQGLLITEEYPLPNKIHAFLNYVSINIIYNATFIIELFFVKNLKQLLDNLPMNICMTACSMKFLVILRLRPSLIEINKQLRRLDNKPMTDVQKKQLEKVISLCRLLAASLIAIYTMVDWTYAAAAVASHGTKLGYESWFPYEWRNHSFRYWTTLTVQTAFQVQLGLQQVANDLTGAVYLCLLTVHLQIILERFASIHYDPGKTEAESFQEFLQCLEDHRIIMGIFEIIQNSISYTIFFQFVASIFVFSTSGLSYLQFSRTATETAAAAIFMVAEVVEIFPSCYYADKFTEKTDQIVFMLYSSNWMDLSPRFRKHLIIFMQMTQKEKIILAGKQIPITLATFMSVSWG
ncbi:odorant receptor 33b-like [Hermetia illucens]|uniref:odorant receptor 33b-like n=1 Tax=Hermetia illucens TaxID=343691 RepID=UPI0018CC763C|nr:odorant receptor 33b-like [Hermetia illucens]